MQKMVFLTQIIPCLPAYTRMQLCWLMAHGISTELASSGYAARFVMNDYARYSSVTNMLNYLSWPTLEQRRNQIKLALFFKIVHGIVDGSTLTLTPLNTITRGHHCRYALPFSRTESYLNSFLPSTIRLWNKLPAILSEIDNINDFNAVRSPSTY